jgi:hypothetical protein
MLKLIKILEFFEIKDKLLEIIINNASNNDTLKNKLKKISKSTRVLIKQTIELCVLFNLYY